MARKFFNQKVSKKKPKINYLYIIIGASIILIIIAVILIIKLTNKKIPENAVIKIREKVSLQLNTEELDKSLFFTELENVEAKAISIKGNYDLNKVGIYDIEIKVYNKKFNSKLEIIDTEAPVIETKNVTITLNDSYKAEDFVKTCTDNSNEPCNILFYTLSVDEKGQAIDYSTYNKVGNYTIQIYAKDNSNNETLPLTANLIIKESADSEEPKVTNKVCKYGNNEYDENKYILSADVSVDSCAVDLNLYQNEATKAPALKLISNDEEKLKNQFKTLNLNVKDIYLNSKMTPIINKKGNGIVGYEVEITLSIINSKNESEIIAKYNLKNDGTRIYSVNKYNIN